MSRAGPGYTYKWQCIYGRQKSSLSAPIFTKLLNVQRHYVHISYTEIHKNRNNRGKHMYKLIYVSTYGFHCVDFHEIHHHPTHFCKYI
jgi:hypothetical protein